MPDGTETDASKPLAEDAFYVGYLPTPPAHLRFVRRLVWALLVWIIALGVFIAAGMRDPGPATWDTGTERTWTGVLVLNPYPMLLPDDASEPLLVVEMAKVGAHERVGPFAGQRVELRGYLLQRDNRRIIELAPDDTALTALGPATTPSDASGSVAVTLEGEIVDGKCYLGAMKPGEGITHKSCATLCVRGGLPPMIVTRENGQDVFRLLLVDGSTILTEPVLALIAEPVRIEGQLTEINGLPVVRTTAADISIR